jgi:hypothetical protein
MVMTFSTFSSVNADSSAYFTGFSGALSHNANPCSSFALYNASLSDCIAGMLDGQEKAASSTELYKIGFAQGKNDYLVLRSDAADACKKFPGSSGDILTKFWMNPSYDLFDHSRT